MNSAGGAILTLFVCCFTFGYGIAPKLVDPSSLPLRTEGSKIVDKEGTHVQLDCVNWYGAHMEMMAMNGLNRRPLDDIANGIAHLGFNCVRVSYSLDLIFKGASMKVPNAEVTLAANPELMEKTALQVFDSTIESLASAGLLVILNDHNSLAGWCCSDTDHDGLWFNDAYPEAKFFEHVTLLTKRYLHLPMVAGFDLRNELRSSDLGTPHWGDGERQLDWSVAAEKAARLVVDINPDMLVIVSGLAYSTMLCSVSNNPLHEKEGLKGRIVYTAHSYSWTTTTLVAANVLDPLIHVVIAVVVTVVLLSVISLAAEWSGIMKEGRWSSCIDRCMLACLQLCVCRDGCGCTCCGRTKISRPVSAAISATVVTIVALAFLLVDCGLMNSCSYAGFMPIVFQPSVLGFGLWMVCTMFWLRVVLLCMAEHRGLVDNEVRELEGSIAPAIDEETPAASEAPGEVEEPNPNPKPVEDNPDHEAPFEVEPAPLAVSTPSTLREKVFRICTSRRVFVIALALLTLCLLLLAQSHLRRWDVVKNEWDFKFGYLVQANTAPVWLGEFGTNSNSIYWQYTLRYMKENDLDFAYWPINGEKRPGQGESFGIWAEDMKTVQQSGILKALQDFIETRRSSDDEPEIQFQ
mmetsp:Transcript_25104/g.54648  ORF Transcript_25104/g.54648 Transcript_25104/m.54648 type:complete len:633 (+) Transcript_25104:87-1985(+)